MENILDANLVINLLFDEVVKVYKKITYSLDDTLNFQWGTDYSVEEKTKTIYIPLIESEQGEIDFANSIIKILNTKENKEDLEKIDMLMYSLYHEIGHLKSKQGDLKSKIGRKIANISNKIGLKKLSRKIYYNLPEEKNATEWACNYISNHYNDILIQQEELKEAFNKFYKDLNLTD